MKEAIVINLVGYMTDVVLVDDAVTGVFPLYKVTPALLDKDGVEITPESTALIGHQVAVQVPAGLHLPKFNLSAWDTYNLPLQPELDANGDPGLDVDGNIVYLPKPNVELWVEGKPFDLEGYKAIKINLLSEQCNQAVLGTFTSSALGEEHIYVFDYEAQMNLAGAKQAFQESLIANIDWNTRDSGVLNHTQAQFNQLWLDGFVHKVSTISKYRYLKPLVEAATNKPEVDAITWE